MDTSEHTVASESERSAARGPESTGRRRRAPVRTKRASGWRWVGAAGGPGSIPAGLARVLAPATCVLREWDEYWVESVAADRLKIGTEWLEPALPGLFRVQFRNRVGLASLQLFAGEQPLGPALFAEVIARPFASIEEHVAFYAQLTADLCARIASLPFALSAPTAWRTTRGTHSSGPLFALHFARAHGRSLRAAFEHVARAPHRELSEQVVDVVPREVTEIGAEALPALLQSPALWPRNTRVAGPRVAHPAATHVSQWRTHERWDTPENRGAAWIARVVAAGCASALHAPWWPLADERDRHAVIETAAAARAFLTRGPFDAVSTVNDTSAVLPFMHRRAGYRDLARLGEQFVRGRTPMHGTLEEALDARDAAALYEAWSFFALADTIGAALGVDATYTLREGTSGGLRAGAVAAFGASRALVYNPRVESYSGALRPDFVWRVDGRDELVFDAKFRLRATPDVDDDARAALRADLDKMHTYRDAIGVRAAVCVFPGTESVFYDSHGSAPRAISVRALISGMHSGVGALALDPRPDARRTR